MTIGTNGVTFATQSLAKANSYMSSKLYKATREIQNNTILNRATIELLGADIPCTLTELVGRNWKTAVEVAFRITLFLVTSFFIPLLFIPILNKLAAKKSGLPENFKKLFYNQFEDLIPEKRTKEGNEEFKQKLIAMEGQEKVNEILGDDVDKHEQKLEEFKQKIVKAKTNVVKKDILYSGLLTYLVPWVQVWFSKSLLGVVGYTGETDLLSESQQEESASFHEKTKYIKFGLGILPTVFGSNWYSNQVQKAATSFDSELKESKFLSFVKKHIKQFDYYKAIYAQRLNLAGTFLFGGDCGFLLASRSLNEFIERCLRLSVFWPTMFFGVEWVNFKLSDKHDKKYDTQIIDHNSPKELGIKKVKNLAMLETELKQAENEDDEIKIDMISKTMKAQMKNYWLSILIDSALMGVGLTAANIAGTKIRVEKFGIY
ncbi:MAG: hypothetical protein HYY52_03245 [Candidatus Melainabacteria bacterium]|nr:hypothetical protein [Candidatus Melainabacteria bacterium]